MSSYKPSAPFNACMVLLVPTIITAKGSSKKSYAEKDNIFCSFRSFGGTESVSDGVLSVVDTATVETWYRPDITADCRLRDTDGIEYEILGTPENISKRNQYLKFKIRAIKGGA